MEERKNKSVVVNSLAAAVWAVWAGMQTVLTPYLIDLWIKVLIKEKLLGYLMLAANRGMLMLLTGAILLAAVALLANIILLIVGKKNGRGRMVKINNVWLWLNLYALPLMMNGWVITFFGSMCWPS